MTYITTFENKSILRDSIFKGFDFLLLWLINDQSLLVMSGTLVNCMTNLHHSWIHLFGT